MRFLVLSILIVSNAHFAYGQHNPPPGSPKNLKKSAPAKECYAAPCKCAVFPVQSVHNGIVHMCDVYHPTCDDYYGWDWGTFEEELYGHDCPSNVNCQPFKVDLQNAAAEDRVDHGALLKKVPVKKLPFGLNPNIRHIRSHYYSFTPDLPGESDEELTYFRVMELLYIDPDKIENSRSLTVAWEMEAPDATIHVTKIEPKIKPISNAQPHLFRLKLSALNLLIVRAGEEKPTLATPDDESGSRLKNLEN